MRAVSSLAFSHDGISRHGEIDNYWVHVERVSPSCVAFAN